VRTTGSLAPAVVAGRRPEIAWRTEIGWATREEKTRARRATFPMASNGRRWARCQAKRWLTTCPSEGDVSDDSILRMSSR
jgi:hypothetical protein